MFLQGSSSPLIHKNHAAFRFSPIVFNRFPGANNGDGFRDENAKDFEALYRTASRYYCDTECAKAVEKQPFRVIFPNFFVRAILPPSPSSSFAMLGAAVVSNTHKTKLTKCVVRRHHDPIVTIGFSVMNPTENTAESSSTVAALG